MNFRDSSVNGQHIGKGIVAGVESSHGANIYGGSTGANFTAVGDDDNISVNVFGKGTGSVVLGNSSSPARIANVFTIEFTPAALAASAASQSTITVTGLSTGRPLLFTPASPGLSAVYSYRVQCSTANELRFTQQNISGSTIGTGESTSRGWLIQL